MPLVVWICWIALDLFFRTFNEEEIRISGGMLTIEQRRPLGFGETSVYQTADVHSVSIRNRTEGGMESVIVVTSANQKTAFGGALSWKEMKYVCAVIRAALVKEMPFEETVEAS